MTNVISKLFQLRVGPISRNVLLSLAMWLIIMFLLGISEAEAVIMVIWGAMGLFGIMLYVWFFQSVIPQARTKRKPFRSYLLRS